MISKQEELADLEEEVKDAQRAFDDDWYTLRSTINHIRKSYEHLRHCEKRLKEFNEF